MMISAVQFQLYKGKYIMKNLRKKIINVSYDGLVYKKNHSNQQNNHYIYYDSMKASNYFLVNKLAKDLIISFEKIKIDYLN